MPAILAKLSSQMEMSGTRARHTAHCSAAAGSGGLESSCQASRVNADLSTNSRLRVLRTVRRGTVPTGSYVLPAGVSTGAEGDGIAEVGQRVECKGSVVVPELWSTVGISGNHARSGMSLRPSLQWPERD